MAGLCKGSIEPAGSLKLKMLKRLVVLCLAVSIATCRHSSSSSSSNISHQWKTRTAAADSELIIDNSDKGYTSYTKLHPGCFTANEELYPGLLERILGSLERRSDRRIQVHGQYFEHVL
ncbi:hypothetical protein ANN_14651 [Periplaneta americana]|uniref:Uncharacterized protein n=1 Tax=Periplaneta americana TaxID=6978 RepID=A0ABQ8SWU4_PERAM|nr:hypothetical protein ANN_14651 [Periplaneta americana]